MKALARYWFPELPAQRLATLRMLVGGFATIYVFARLSNLLSAARFNAELFRPVGVVSILEQPLPSAAVYALVFATALAGCAFTLGYRFRFFGPLFAFLLLWTLSYRNSWRMIFHTENLMVLQVLAIGLAPAADAWALDARGRALPQPSGRYGWPIRLMMWVTVASYLLAGIAKVRWGGPVWLDGEVLRNLVATDTVRKMLLGSFYSPFSRTVVEWDAAFAALAWVTLIFELGAPLALLGPRLAKTWVVVAISFHWGVLVIMMIVFPYPMSGVAFVCFLPVERRVTAIKAVWRRRRGLGEAA